MISGEKIKPCLLGLGYYTSPQGGSVSPKEIAQGEYLFELVTRGRGKHPERDEWTGPGWIYFHRPGQKTICESPGNEGYECMTAVFSLKEDSSQWPRSFFWENTRGAENFSREMLFAFHQEGISMDLLGDLIWAQFQLRRAQHEVRQTSKKIPPRIAAVIEAISKHPEKDHSMKNLAEKIGWSASHLHTEFKAATGKTPHQMVIQYRMSVARHRLATTSDPVKAIAFDVGYTNTENFCRAFKKLTGLTAAGFRNKYTLYE